MTPRGRLEPMLLLPILSLLAITTAPSDVPPKGPPWKLTYAAAREHALRAGQPVFVYFTKTYCPHCVPVEKMLSSTELKPVYGQVTWLFVSRNFDGDAKDREALRTHDRFGISSWPQMIVFDPRNDRVLAEPPRDLDGFLATLRRAGGEGRFRADADPAPVEETRAAAIALEDAALAVTGGAAPPIAAEDALDRLLDADEDVVVRVRALRYLRAVAPEQVADRAAGVLDVPNDPLRYEALQVLAAHPNPELSATLATMFRDAGDAVPSRNPNVLRGHVARALATSGDADAAEALRGIAEEANPLNATTRTVVETLASIGRRAEGSDRERIVAMLLAAFPAGRDDPCHGPDPHPALARAARALAETVRTALAEVTGRKDLPPVPADWTVATRKAFVAGLR